MRGLTALERAWLSDPDPIDDDEVFTSTLLDMRRVGRVSHEESEGDDLWPNTDLGDLALRVCPTEEA